MCTFGLFCARWLKLSSVVTLSVFIIFIRSHRRNALCERSRYFSTPSSPVGNSWSVRVCLTTFFFCIDPQFRFVATRYFHEHFTGFITRVTISAFRETMSENNHCVRCSGGVWNSNLAGQVCRRSAEPNLYWNRSFFEFWISSTRTISYACFVFETTVNRQSSKALKISTPVCTRRRFGQRYTYTVIKIKSGRIYVAFVESSNNDACFSRSRAR